MKSEVFNMDCMIGMKQFPDKYFDLAVVDPPYGIGDINHTDSRDFHKKIKWNNSVPDKKYFDEVIRVSENQIIWGINYYAGMVPHVGRLVHDKSPSNKQYPNLSDGDIASHSFGVNVRIFRYEWRGNVQGGIINWKNSGVDARIHPTQKPVALYSWIYKNYLPQGGKVIDTHLGSGSNRIAAHKAGNIDFTGYELDKEYFDAAEKRYKNFASQTVLFQ